jgi:hypothetical protein
MMAVLIQQGAVLLCPHGGLVEEAAGVHSSVLLSGQPALTSDVEFPIVGCPAAPPCAKVQWLAPATRVRLGGRPALVAGAGMCLSDGGVPQGPVTVVAAQTRVEGE